MSAQLEMISRSDGMEDPNERYTPRALFEPLDKEFSFTLDVCATAESAKCERFFTKAEDGLVQPWNGEDETVWCNPPFDNIEAWVKKAWAEKTCNVVMLVPAWTDRKWWHKHVEPFRDCNECGLQTRFLPGRVRFGFPGNPEGHGQESPPFWCALLIWRRW